MLHQNPLFGLITDSELKKGKIMFICVFHGFQPECKSVVVMKLKGPQDFIVKYDVIFSEDEVY